MMTMNKSSCWAWGLFARLHVALRASLAANLDATISNVSPFTPICEGTEVYASRVSPSHFPRPGCLKR